METNKPQALRLATLTSEETPVEGATRTVAMLHPDTARYLEGVTAVVRLLKPDEIRVLEQKHRLPDKTGGKGIEWKVDKEALLFDLLVLGVQSWTGILGADNKPMRVCPAALRALDDLNKAHLAAVAKTPAEVVDPDVIAASFREPADVAALDR